MLGLILLYWIGKYFYKLAEEFNKQKWGFAILGIVIYYAGSFLFGGIIMFVIELISEGFIENTNDFVLSLIAIPFGILACYLLYAFLEKKWKSEAPKSDELINQIGKEES